jgi:two-component system NtrC family response regulator
MTRVLVIDDEHDVCEVLSHAIQKGGYEPAYANTLGQGLDLAQKDHFEAVVLDVCMPDGNGLDFLPRFLELPSSPEVIIITGKGDPDGAELSLSRGAFDYIEKPASLNQVMLPLVRALEYREARLQRTKPRILRREGIIGSSQQISHCLESLADAAATQNSVLISGDTGTGKELFARALHANSSRRESPFVVLDCAALTESLVESILFGYVRGAFTGAVSDRSGLIAQAHSGTLFMDEIGELTLEMQKKFLRVMDDKRFRPVGGQQVKQSDFRVVAATNRSLASMVERGRFRGDLLYRINTHEIHIPPLKERKEDIPEIANHINSKRCRDLGLEPKGIAPEVLEMLNDYHWPGNVRELIHTMDKMMAAAQNESVLHPHHLPVHLRVTSKRKSLQGQTDPSLDEVAQSMAQTSSMGWRAYRDHIATLAEKHYFEALYEQTGGNVRDMARRAGLTQARIYGLLKKHDLGKNG